MRAARPVLALTLVASLSAAGAASAVTKPKPKPVKPVCNLIVDPSGDASLQPPLPSDDSLDIIGGDVASDAKNLTAVIRLKAAAASPQAELGRHIEMTFDLAGAVAQVWIGYDSSAYGGQTFQYGLVGQGTGGSTSPTGNATGVVDTAKNEIRMTVPLASMNALGKAKPGAKVSNIAITTAQIVGIAPNPSGAYANLPETVDDASATKNYVAGTPSCVKPGA